MEKWGAKNNFRYEAFVYGGLRTYFQRVQSELNGADLALKINPVWVEPIIGLENQFTWKRWMVTLQGDYGSITSRSRQTYQLSAFVFYRMGKLTSIKFGWNHLYINRTDEFLRQDLKINLTLSGPSVAVSFHF